MNKIYNEKSYLKVAAEVTDAFYIFVTWKWLKG